MAKHTEATELIAAAVEAIQAALTLGDEQGHKERWRGQEVYDHLGHANIHADDAHTEWGSWHDHQKEAKRETQQALCRLAMALVKMG